MKQKTSNKEILKVLLFVLPYIFVEFTNIILITIDRSLSNSIGKIAIIVFASLISLDSAINTIQECISQSHSIVLARDKSYQINFIYWWHMYKNTTTLFNKIF